MTQWYRYNFKNSKLQTYYYYCSNKEKYFRFGNPIEFCVFKSTRPRLCLRVNMRDKPTFWFNSCQNNYTNMMFDVLVYIFMSNVLKKIIKKKKTESYQSCHIIIMSFTIIIPRHNDFYLKCKKTEPQMLINKIKLQINIL